jgi:hypothetical protein
VTERFPDKADGFIGQAEALTHLDRFDEAEDLLERAKASFPADSGAYAEYARLAMRRGDPGEALSRWAETVRRFPEDNLLAQELFLARLQAAEIDPAAVMTADSKEDVQPHATTEETNSDLPPMQELVCTFESLGGTLLGCEFGLFQRAHGAEPLGLLRWTDMEPDGLIAALEAEFEGVGLPDNTELVIPPDIAGEYGTRDYRFGMRMHTFMSRREVPADKMYAQVCRRLQFLRDKLVADLGAGEKIFVYKITTRNLPEDELHRLHATVRRYGDNTLLYVRYADPEHPAGTVERAAPGLLIGYVERFAVSASGEGLGAQTVAWTDICRKAYRLWRGRIGPEAAIDGGSRPEPAYTATLAGSPRKLLMQFESLGGSGHGCEFGLLQREFGAEPLGLLRWADLAPHLLAEALETEFDGVGLPENTILFVPETAGRPEYWTRDSRYWMAMRTFVPVDEMPLAEICERACRRLQFLKCKLTDDLRSGDKIFVYKVLQRNLPDDELERIHSAMRRYDDNTLLYVRYEDDAHPNGTVELAKPGLLVGYIDRFSHSPEDVYVGDATSSWLPVCEEAYRLWSSAKATGSAVSGLTSDPQIAVQEAWAAHADANWAKALGQWEDVRKRFPHIDIRQGVTIALSRFITTPPACEPEPRSRRARKGTTSGLEMTRIIFVGNCHAEALCRTLRRSNPALGFRSIDNVASYESLGEVDRERIRDADIIIEQVQDFEPRIGELELKTGQRRYSFPLVTGMKIAVPARSAGIG